MVGTGIYLSNEQLQQVNKLFEEVADKTKKFTIKAGGFGAWDNWKGAVEGRITPFVIYLKVEVNEKLQNLFNSLKEVTDDYEVWLPRIEDYKPHITLAFADLDEIGYKKGLGYVNSLSDFSLYIDINSFSLTECYGVGNMESVEWRRYNLKQD